MNRFYVTLKATETGYEGKRPIKKGQRYATTVDADNEHEAFHEAIRELSGMALEYEIIEITDRQASKAQSEYRADEMEY
jgi:hypothetical protein